MDLCLLPLRWSTPLTGIVLITALVCTFVKAVNPHRIRISIDILDIQIWCGLTALTKVHTKAVMSTIPVRGAIHRNGRRRRSIPDGY
eukprot:10483208-Ditylum_brightwellii.AAC.1